MMKEYHLIDYGHAIKTVRVARNMTQRELAKVSGTVGNYISFIESNSKRPSVDMLEAIAVGLRVPVWLLVMVGSHPNDLGPEVAPLVPKMLADYVNSR
jgi:transcriptional regulator with XRE-family HTH domain